MKNSNKCEIRKMQEEGWGEVIIQDGGQLRLKSLQPHSADTPLEGLYVVGNCSITCTEASVTYQLGLYSPVQLTNAQRLHFTTDITLTQKAKIFFQYEHWDFDFE
jgi:hypothetical protein